MKFVWSFFTAGMLFLILGTGNLLVGTSRAQHYQKLLHAVPIDAVPIDAVPIDAVPVEAKEVLSSSSGQAFPSAESSTAHRTTLEQRHEYYRFCIVGGKYFLALSGCLLLAGLIAARIFARMPPKDFDSTA